MALILKDKKYVILKADGEYFIFKNKTARGRNKKAVSSTEILAEYSKKLAEFDKANDIERAYYDPEYFKEFEAWEAESIEYYTHLTNYDTSGKYPLMEQIFPKINDSIPEILGHGWIGIRTSSDEEAYKLAKELGCFGPAEDLKDA